MSIQLFQFVPAQTNIASSVFLFCPQPMDGSVFNSNVTYCELDMHNWSVQCVCPSSEFSICSSIFSGRRKILAKHEADATAPGRRPSRPAWICPQSEYAISKSTRWVRQALTETPCHMLLLLSNRAVAYRVCTAPAYRKAFRKDPSARRKKVTGRDVRWSREKSMPREDRSFFRSHKQNEWMHSFETKQLLLTQIGLANALHL